MVQVATNTAKKCGFTGLRWPNFKPGMDAMMSEIKARKNLLKGC